MTADGNKKRTPRAIFLAVRQVATPDEQSQWLDEMCAGQDELRRQVKEMLVAAQSEQTNPLEHLGAMLNATEWRSDSPLTNIEKHPLIGPYRLHQRLGEGGMGEVFLAEQRKPLHRTVALKLIKRGMDSREVLARFEAERQALSLMNHPYIAKVFDAGESDDGRPYFVMELVRGISITDYCDQHKLTTRERLELFVNVCQAVQHAHQKGVIHRDLKPSNILVELHDVRHVPKVIDFGVAKAINQRLTERTLLTRFSQMIGTPLYMSPEQAELSGLDVDTRSDVYSLGVLLYELLTGSTPFDSETLKQADFDEMRRIIREDEPPKPSAKVSTLKAEALSTVSQRRASDPRRLSDSLAGELDWLVMKALEKDRTRRYESASALAADIERYLDGQAVEACPPSATYRFKKFAFRNKAVLATTTIVLITLLLGIAGTSWQAWRATRALATASEERENALKNFRRARNTVDTFLKTVEENELLQNPEMQPLRHELLDISRRYFREFIDDGQNQPELEADLADAYLRVGDIAWTLGELGSSIATDRKTVEIRQKLAADNPQDPEHQHNLAATYLAVSNHGNENQLDYLRKAIETANTLPNTPKYQHTLAKAYARLGNVICRQYQNRRDKTPTELREGAESAEQGSKLFEQLIQLTPEVAEYRMGLGESYALIGQYRMIDFKRSERDDFHQRALAVLEKLVDDFPDNAEYSSKLASVYYNDVQAEAEKSFEIVRSLSEKNPTVVRYQHTLINLHLSLADIRKDAPERAVENLKRAVELANDLVNRHARNWMFRKTLARCYLALGRLQLKEQNFEQGIASLQAAITHFIHYTTKERTDVGDLIDAYAYLSEPYQAAGRVEEALSAGRNALELAVERVKSNKNMRWVWGRSNVMQHYASLLYRGGKVQEALVEAQRAVKLQEQAITDGGLSNATGEVAIRCHEVLMDCNRDIAQYQEAVGRYAEAADAYRRALEAEAQVIRVVPGAEFYNSPNHVYNKFMAATQKSGNRREAELFLRKELATWQDLLKISKVKESCRIRELELQLRLAVYLAELNRHDEASAFYRDARVLFAELSASEPEWVAKTITTCIHVCPHRKSELPADAYQSDFLEAIDQQLASALDVAREKTKKYPAMAYHEHWCWDAWSTLAVAYYRPLQWEGAAAEARLAIKLAPNEPEKLQLLAPLLLLAGNLEEYQALCKRLLAEESKFWNHDHLKKLLPLCLLDPQPENPEKLLSLAQKAVVGTPADHVLSVAYYRAGEPQQAIDGLMSALKSTSGDEPIIELHLAISHHLAGHQEEASVWLDKGRRHQDSVVGPANRLAYEVLLQQAEQLIAASQPATPHEQKAPATLSSPN